MRKSFSKFLVLATLLVNLVPNASVHAQETVELDFAALESAYGTDMWPEIIEAYKTVNPNVNVTLTQEKNLEDALVPRFQSGDIPDVVMLGLSREKALPETLIKDNALEDVTDLLDIQIPGEETAVKDKLLPGFTDSTATNPYSDGKTYLMPMFYSPTGLFYNKGLFEEKEWEVPKTWDEMFALGDKAKEEGIALFTYPTAGYLDTFFSSTLYNIGGQEFFNQAMNFDAAAWENDSMKNVFDTLGKLATYTEGTTVANANPNDYTRNQQLILDNKALFMPNGTWIVQEMAEAPRADKFAWGMTALPTAEADQDKYAYTFVEQIWVPSGAEQVDAAKEFIAFLYSDVAADIFAKHGAVQPIQGLVEKLPEDQKVFYGIYDEGILPGMGGFVSTEAIPGLDLKGVLYSSFDSVVSGDLTTDDWYNQVVTMMQQFSEVIIK